MQYNPVPSIEIFAEAVAVPPILHVDPIKPLNVIAFGPYALPLAKLALRYPQTEKVYLVAIDKAPPLQDRRVKVLDRVEELPSDLKANLIGVAVPGDPQSIMGSLRKFASGDCVGVVAVDRVDRGRALKDALGKTWSHVLPYRELCPEPALFLMVSDRKFGKPLRPFPAGLHRLTPRYLSNLFTLAKDEYRLLFGSETS